MKEFEFYHGLVFTQLLHSTEETVHIRQYPSRDNASYVVNEITGIYIKYSTKRLSPWTFTFKKRHQAEVRELKKGTGEVFLLLVCDDDGVVALSFDELKQVLNHHYEDVEWIRVSRGRRKMYSVRGTDGSLSWKVGRSDFPAKILQASVAEPKDGVHKILGFSIEKERQ